MWQKISSVACVIFMKNIFVPGEVDKKARKNSGAAGRSNDYVDLPNGADDSRRLKRLRRAGDYVSLLIFN